MLTTSTSFAAMLAGNVTTALAPFAAVTFVPFCRTGGAT
jgi:hypothetical protein